jgi:hypothetical protein
VTLNDAIRLWATPQSRDHFPPHSPERIAAMKAEGHGMRNLNDEAAHWRTPMAADDGQKVTSVSHQVMLRNQAEQWQTPATDSFRSRGGDRKDEQGLDQQARSFSPQVLETPAGQQSSETRRTLNPLFVEWLMGWPIGWTASEPVETGLSRWLQHARGLLSTLCSPPTPKQPDLFG